MTVTKQSATPALTRAEKAAQTRAKNGTKTGRPRKSAAVRSVPPVPTKPSASVEPDATVAVRPPLVDLDLALNDLQELNARLKNATDRLAGQMPGQIKGVEMIVPMQGPGNRQATVRYNGAGWVLVSIR